VEDTTKEFPGQWAKKRLKNNTDPRRLAMFETEVRAVQSIKHPNVLKVVDSDLSADRPYFVAEYCERGSLQKVGAAAFRGNIRTTLAVVLPILDALVAAHKVKVFHRDLKPPNILFRGDGSPVIGDFGICFREGEEHFTLSDDAIGSINFIAPEMESGQHGLGEPSNRTDVYSLGKVIYWMLSGGKMFAREDFPSLVDLLSDPRFEHVHRLLKEMVVRDPAERVQSHELKKKLEMTASLVEGNFAPMAPSLGIRCRFCGLGKYERFTAFDARDPSKSFPYPRDTSQLGLHPVTPGTNVRCLRCTNCGHIEWFQVTGIKIPTWWEK
jgi:serine/threonine protein kinase